MKEQAKEKIKKLARRFRDRWIKYKYWIYCLILTLAVILIIYYVPTNECPENARYILSAISQGLAAILALVFTITLVVAQMTRRYTAMDKIIFRRETKFLMILFGIGIIAPLLVLEFGFWEWGVHLSIVIASFCVFSLLPFLIGVNMVLKYEIGFVNLYGETLDAIKLENEANVVKGIIDLESICLGAIEESREETTSEIIYFLSDIGEKMIEIAEMKNATGNLILRLGNIGIDAIEKEFKDATLFFLVKALGDLRIGAAKNTWKLAALQANYMLEEVGCKAIEKKRSDVDVVICGLRYIGPLDDITKFHQVNDSSVRALCCLGVLATKHLPDTNTVDIIIQNLKKYGITMARLSAMNWEKYFTDKYAKLYFTNKYTELEPTIKKFKERYDQL